MPRLKVRRPEAVERRLDSIAQSVLSRPPETVPFNCVTALLAVLPTVVMTFGSHYWHLARLKGDPRRSLRYHEALAIVDAFLYYSSFQTVEQMQAFTLQKVASPRWAKNIPDTIPPDILSSAANLVINQLGPEGIARVGGKKWWQWRGPQDTPLSGEWIEMLTDFEERKRNGDTGNRVILYLHGGAFYFGSVHSHRYQIQRHARLLKGRAFALDYRLAPQYPFPCALQDVLGAYLYLLALYSPKEIIFFGDSAGASLALSSLVTLRDQKIPLPAGVVLSSPWVDLTASMPSMGEDSEEDYLPAYGLMQAPSVSFPPPNCDEMEQLASEYLKSLERGEIRRSADSPPVEDFNLNGEYGSVSNPNHQHFGRRIPPLVVEIAGERIELKDQIWPYTTNDMIAHPLTSPIFQPSLGGLPRMMVISGSGERLRDEQTYIAHKAANPQKYAPDDTILDKFDPNRTTLTGYPPTQVHFQVYDGMCHDALAMFSSWPSQCMYFAVAQFSAQCLADAQQTVIDIPDALYHGRDKRALGREYQCGRVGDPLPQFDPDSNMIRQRVNSQGAIYLMEPESQMRALQYPNTEIGRIQPCVAVNWLAAKKLWDMQFKKRKRQIQQQRLREMKQAIRQLEPDEIPPACSQAARYGLPEVPRRLPRGGHILNVYNALTSALDTRSLRRRGKKSLPVLRIGAAAPPSASIARASAYPAPTAGIPSTRRSTAYGLPPQAPITGSATARMSRGGAPSSRQGSRAPSDSSPALTNATSPKRLASMDVGVHASGAGQKLGQQQDGGQEEQAGAGPRQPTWRHQSSVAPPPALMDRDSAGSSMQAHPSTGHGNATDSEAAGDSSAGAAGQQFASFARHGGVSGDAGRPGKRSGRGPRASDISPGSTAGQQAQQDKQEKGRPAGSEDPEHKYSSITAPIIPAQDDSPSNYARGHGGDESSPNNSASTVAYVGVIVLIDSKEILLVLR
ncbi:hypothetical protein KEM52_001703 [Ascosphaera acerosa]|nr:hypothetical protein KEM52_001703 [Ascosphaera acerosa]